MRKSITCDEYEYVTHVLKSLRQHAGLTQRQLAQRMGREQSFVWRAEKAERRLDLLEFHWYCSALGVDSCLIFEQIRSQWQAPYPALDESWTTRLPHAADHENHGD